MGVLGNRLRPFLALGLLTSLLLGSVVADAEVMSETSNNATTELSTTPSSKQAGEHTGSSVSGETNAISNSSKTDVAQDSSAISIGVNTTRAKQPVKLDEPELLSLQLLFPTATRRLQQSEREHFAKLTRNYLRVQDILLNRLNVLDQDVILVVSATSDPGYSVSRNQVVIGPPLVRKSKDDALKQQGKNATILQLKNQIAKRDERDTTRKTAPLQAADDAHLIDTTELDINAVMANVINLINGQSS